MAIISPEAAKTSEPKRKSEVVEEVPTYTTKEETDRFNDWYLQRIHEDSNTSTDALMKEVQAINIEQDKEVDHDHTKKLQA